MQLLNQSNGRLSWLLAGLAALLFIPFLGYVHLFDWDEINFAEISREMMVLGNYTRTHVTQSTVAPPRART